jgi:hypothetical protein
MAIDFETAKSISKIIPMLGSDVETEVTAAAAAIKRKLAASGNTLNDLAAILLAARPGVGVVQPTQHEEPTRFWGIDTPRYVIGIAPVLLDRLTRKIEKEFVEEMRRGARRLPDFKMTKNQFEIWDKLLRENGF